MAVLGGAGWWAYGLWLAMQAPSRWTRAPGGPTEAQRRYEALRLTADPGTLIPAIHRAYREFLGDPLFGAYWQVTRLRWTVNEPDTLYIESSLPAVGGDDGAIEGAGTLIELPNDVRGKVLNYARGLGWAAEFEESAASFRVPVSHSPRSAAEAQAIRLPEPRATDDAWHYRRMMQDFQVLGGIRVINARNRPETRPRCTWSGP